MTGQKFIVRITTDYLNKRIIRGAIDLPEASDMKQNLPLLIHNIEKSIKHSITYMFKASTLITQIALNLYVTEQKNSMTDFDKCLIANKIIDKPTHWSTKKNDSLHWALLLYVNQYSQSQLLISKIKFDLTPVNGHNE